MDTDKAVIVDVAAVHHGLVPYGNAAPHGQRRARIDMQHGTILNVGFGTDRNRVVIRTQYGVEPDADVVADENGTHQRRVVRDVVILRFKNDATILEIENHESTPARIRGERTAACSSMR